MSHVEVEITEDCFSYGRCIDVAPGVFSWADDGTTDAGPVAPGDEEAVVMAVDGCPRFAIKMHVRGDDE